MITLIFLIVLIVSDSLLEIPKRIHPIVFAENVDLERYSEQKTIQLNENDLIVIARPDEYDANDEGLRLIYLRRENQRFKIQYISKGAGESYIFKPSFYEFTDSTKLIFAELGSEYSWGLEVFELKAGEVKYFGTIDVADGRGYNPSTIVPNMIIQRDENGYKIGFEKEVIINPGGQNEKKVDGETIEYRQKQDKLLMLRKVS